MRGRWFRALSAITLAIQFVLAGSGGAYAAPAPSLASAPPPSAPQAPATAPQSTLFLNVVAATSSLDGKITKGQPVTSYKWLLNRDNTGNPNDTFQNCQPWKFTPNPNNSYPDGCAWPSVRNVLGGTGSVALAGDGCPLDVFSQGDNTKLNATTGISTGPAPSTSSCPNYLPPGRWFIQVNAPGYKLGVAYFAVPLSTAAVSVALEPQPLPTTTVRIKVFNDLLTNGEYDVPGEPGLPGFAGHLIDRSGEVTNDFWGNPLCTQYVLGPNGKPALDSSGKPTVAVVGGKCVSDAKGDIVIPNLPPNKYEVQVVPPNGSSWAQTTTLEGSIGWDTWRAEGETGFKTEPTDVGAPEAEVTMGFVQPTWLAGYPNIPITGSPSITGGIKGQVMGLTGYSPPAGGLAFGSEAGNRLSGPISRPWIAVGSLQMGDTNIYVGRGNLDGTFSIQGVPDGDYIVSAWDNDLNMLMESQEISVIGGKVTDVGVFYVLHWFGITEGKVCVDVDLDGKCGPGDPGIPNLTLNILSRDNSIFEDGSNTAVTDANGHYIFRQTYELNDWVVEQGYFEHYKTIGVTYQTDNQPTETTILGAGVDVNLYTLVGGHARIDWAVAPYAAGTNGGIVGEMVAQVTRLNADPRLAANLPQDAGIPGIPVNLYNPILCSSTIAPWAPCETAPNGARYKLAPDGSYLKAPLLDAQNKPVPLLDSSGRPVLDPNGHPLYKPWLLNQYTSETWARPKNGAAGQEQCVARDVTGVPITYPFLPVDPADPKRLAPKPGADCIPSFTYGEQVFTDFQTSSGNTTVNGNYGFTTIATDQHGNPTNVALPNNDYIVEPQIPTDPLFKQPIYVPIAEEDVNFFSGPQVVPQLPPMPCIGPLHVVHVTNPDYLAAGGSPYEGQSRHLCGDKLVTAAAQRSVTPNFFWRTAVDIPLPARMRGVVTDDLNLSADPNETMYGEKAGIPNLPLGIYDFAGQLVRTVSTDPNGIFETLLPAGTYTNCPNPASACPSVYRVVANDPGQPGRVNVNRNPQYRTLVANFDVWSNNTLLYADLAPTPIHLAIEGPPNQSVHPAACQLDPTQPQVFAVSTPYVKGSGTITLTGQGFGTSPGRLLLGGSLIDEVTSWTDRQIVFGVNTDPGEGPPFAPGAYQVSVMAANGLASVNGLTVHVLGTGYNPALFEVGPGKPYAKIQDALEAAATAFNAGTKQTLVVVWPGTPVTDNPLGAYFENIIVHVPVKLQGVGPGGTYADGSHVVGSVIDGFGFGNDRPRDTAWRALMARLSWSGNQNVEENQVVYVVAQDAQWTADYPATIDGLTIQGGDQLAFPSNLNDNGGDPLPLSEREKLSVLVQGGGIFVNGYAHYLRITNNALQSNGGSYGGAIRVGTPYVGDNHNDNLKISNNRIFANGGHNLAGAVGLFNGAAGYEVSYNDICGNYSSEYGGGISHYGYSPNGTIHDNKVYNNGAYDHGGGIILLGEQPTNPATTLSAGTGSVTIYNNVIQSNVSNDDGGGLAIESVENFLVNVFNNFIVNNVSTHEGGGVALDDAPNVIFNSNTVMKNLTTGTSFHGTGASEPAGLSTAKNSVLLQNTLPPGSSTYSNPAMFNNIFYDNRAGHWALSALNVVGIGQSGDSTPINYWDLGPADCPQGQDCGEALAPTNSILTTPGPVGSIIPDASNLIGNAVANFPKVKSLYDTGIQVMPWRGDPHFVGTVTIGIDEPNIRMGDYHLVDATSPAYNAGAASHGAVTAPSFDIDYDPRPTFGGFEIGADQIGPASAADNLPNQPVLDNFNRPDGQLNSFMSNWYSVTPNSTCFQIFANALQATCDGFVTWNGPNATFGANQEVYASFTNVLQTATRQDLLLKVVPSFLVLDAPGQSYIDVQYDAINHRVLVNTVALSPDWFFSGSLTTPPPIVQATIPNVTFRIGDEFRARAFSDGSVYVYQNGRRIGSVNVTATTTPWPAANATGGGQIGILYAAPSGAYGNFNELDNFGGGTLP